MLPLKAMPPIKNVTQGTLSEDASKDGTTMQPPAAASTDPAPPATETTEQTESEGTAAKAGVDKPAETSRQPEVAKSASQTAEATATSPPVKAAPKQSVSKSAGPPPPPDQRAPAADDAHASAGSPPVAALASAARLETRRNPKTFKAKFLSEEAQRRIRQRQRTRSPAENLPATPKTAGLAQASSSPGVDNPGSASGTRGDFRSVTPALREMKQKLAAYAKTKAAEKAAQAALQPLQASSSSNLPRPMGWPPAWPPPASLPPVPEAEQRHEFPPQPPAGGSLLPDGTVALPAPDLLAAAKTFQPVEQRRAWREHIGNLGDPAAVEQLAREVKLVDTSGSAAPKRPLFVDIMCGTNSPIARAMAWCGWDTETFDKARGQDLTNLDVATASSNAVSRSQAYWIAITCATLTKAREIPLAGRVKPRALRSSEQPWGLPAAQMNPPLDAAEKETLREANELITNSLEFCKIGDLEGSLGTIENPGRSLLFDIEDVKKLSDPARGEQAWQEVRYDNCAQGGIRRKHQMLLTRSMLLVDAFQDSVCRHSHHPDEWRSIVGEDGHRGIWATKEESSPSTRQYHSAGSWRWVDGPCVYLGFQVLARFQRRRRATRRCCYSCSQAGQPCAS